MNDEGESSRAQRHGESSTAQADPDDALRTADVETEYVEDEKEQQKWIQERRLDAKRKRIRMLNELLRELDMMVYMQLITLYYSEYGHPLPFHSPPLAPMSRP